MFWPNYQKNIKKKLKDTLTNYHKKRKFHKICWQIFQKIKEYGNQTDKFIIKYRISINISSYVKKNSKIRKCSDKYFKNWNFLKMCWRIYLKLKKYDKCTEKFIKTCKKLEDTLTNFHKKRKFHKMSWQFSPKLKKYDNCTDTFIKNKKKRKINKCKKMCLQIF